MTKILFKRGQAEANLPTLDPGEPAITFESGGSFWIGTPSGNLEITGGGGGSPGGSDTQIQFNDGGAFGGDSGLVWNKTSDTLTLTDAKNSPNIEVVTSGTGSEASISFTDGSETYAIGVDESDGYFKFAAGGSLAIGNIIFESDFTGVSPRFAVFGTLGNDPGIEFDGVNSITEFSLQYAVAHPKVSSGYIFYSSLTSQNFGIGGQPAIGDILTVTDGTNLIISARASNIALNESGVDIDFRVEGDTATNLFVTDAGLDAVQIGTTTAGAIADFRSSAIVFNELGADVDFRIEGDTDQNLFFVDAGNDRVGIGTATPTAYLNLEKTTTGAAASPVVGALINNIYSPTTNPGSVFPISLQLTSDFNSTITPSGGFQLAQLLDVRNSGNGTLSARLLDILFRNTGTGTVGFITGANIRTPINSGGGAITTAYGLKIENQNIATTNYAIYTDAGTVRFGGGVVLGSPTGGDKGVGWINVSGGISRNNTNYNNPDYVTYHYFNGGDMGEFASNPGAKNYNGLLPIEELEDFMKENNHLPNRRDSTNIFDWADMAQMWSEELAIYITQLHKRIKTLEESLI